MSSLTQGSFDRPIADLRPWIELRFGRSSGPGGQNVNKVNTRVTLLLDWQACAVLTDRQKAAIARQLATRLSRDGRLRVVAQTRRSQTANRAAAEGRLMELLRQATRMAKPRRPTKPTQAAHGRRLNEKRRRSRTKQQRGERAEPE